MPTPTSIQASLLGAGTILKSYGTLLADASQADAEEKNASFYREQAAFAKSAGERQRAIFDDQSLELQGAQASAFAKGGSGTQNQSLFVAKQALSRQQESAAIKQEADMNTRLAMLRADQAQSHADDLNSPLNQALTIGSNVAGLATLVL